MAQQEVSLFYKVHEEMCRLTAGIVQELCFGCQHDDKASLKHHDLCLFTPPLEQLEITFPLAWSRLAAMNIFPLTKGLKRQVRNEMRRRNLAEYHC